MEFTAGVVVFILGFLFCLIIAVGALSIFLTILEHITNGRSTEQDDNEKYYH